jgi:putative endonuclease
MKFYNYYVYILTNKGNNVFYIGMTNDLGRRLFEHKEGLIDGFTKKYRVNKLIYYEIYKYVDQAISREKQLKGWRREKKLNLIKQVNPNFEELPVE